MKTQVRIIVNLIFGTAITFVLILFVISPLLSDVTGANAQIKEKKVELAGLDEQIRAFKSAQTDLAKATRQADIGNIFVTRENLVLTVKDLENAVAQGGGSDESLNIQDDAASIAVTKTANVISGLSNIKEIPYTLSFTSDYLGAINFLRYAEHLPHFTEISKITLSADLAPSSTTAIPAHTGKVKSNFNGVFFTKTTAK